MENFPFQMSHQAAVTQSAFRWSSAVKEKGQRANTDPYRQLSSETKALRFVDQHHMLSFTFF